MKFLIAVLMVCSASAHAGVFIEPYAGYALGTSDVSFDDTEQGEGEVSGKVSGFAYGAKAGISFFFVSLGVDYMSLSTTYRYNNVTVDQTGQSKITATPIGPYVGLDLMMFKVGVSIFMPSKFHNQEDLGYVDFKASAMKIGLSYSPIPFFALNLDYLTFKSSSANWDGGGQSGDMDTYSNKGSLVMLGFSFPLGI